MKIGCHVSSLQLMRAAPYDAAFDLAARLGFDAVETLAISGDELEDYYTPDTTRHLRRLADDAGLEISQFAAFSPFTQGVLSSDKEARQVALGQLRRATDIAADLGAPLLNLVSHWPHGMSVPHAYPPSYIHPVSRGMQSWPSSKLEVELARGFDAGEQWRLYLASLDEIASYCGSRGIRLAIEGHANVLVSGADAMLRLFDQLPDAPIVVNFDTAWHLIQREYLPLSIHKLAGRIAHVHLRDGDGLINYLLPVGEGIVDWPGTVAALRATGFDGVLSFEYSGFRDFESVAARSLEYMRTVIDETNQT